MSRTDPQVNFRMPAELKQKLEKAAANNHRSTTAEIVARLEESFLMEGDDDLLEMCIEEPGPNPEITIAEPKVYSEQDFLDAVNTAFQLLGARTTPEKVAEIKARRKRLVRPARER